MKSCALCCRILVLDPIAYSIVSFPLSHCVTVPVNAKNVCAYKQHPGTRFPNQSGDQEDEEGITPSQRQEVCPDGQEACFTLWREEAAAAASAAPAAGNQSTSAPVGLESKDSHAVVFVIIAQGKRNERERHVLVIPHTADP